ncbi:hypothetical protein HN446_02075 [bacterium]|nr:hypothetical protein [bacterium]
MKKTILILCIGLLITTITKGVIDGAPEVGGSPHESTGGVEVDPTGPDEPVPGAPGDLPPVSGPEAVPPAPGDLPAPGTTGPADPTQLGPTGSPDLPSDPGPGAHRQPVGSGPVAPVDPGSVPVDPGGTGAPTLHDIPGTLADFLYGSATEGLRPKRPKADTPKARELYASVKSLTRDGAIMSDAEYGSAVREAQRAYPAAERELDGYTTQLEARLSGRLRDGALDTVVDATTRGMFGVPDGATLAEAYQHLANPDANDLTEYLSGRVMSDPKMSGKIRNAFRKAGLRARDVDFDFLAKMDVGVHVEVGKGGEISVSFSVPSASELEASRVSLRSQLKQMYLSAHPDKGGTAEGFRQAKANIDVLRQKLDATYEAVVASRSQLEAAFEKFPTRDFADFIKFSQGDALASMIKAVSDDPGSMTLIDKMHRSQSTLNYARKRLWPDTLGTTGGNVTPLPTPIPSPSSSPVPGSGPGIGDVD